LSFPWSNILIVRRVGEVVRVIGRMLTRIAA